MSERLTWILKTDFLRKELWAPYHIKNDIDYYDDLCEKYNYSRGEKEKRALEALSEIDMLMKTTSLSPWTYLESFLLQVS